jgi:hypothetical protein
MSRRDYEMLPAETRVKAVDMLESIKKMLRARFSLRFLGHDGKWRDLTPPKFLALSEDHYHRLIKGSRGVTSRYKEELLDKIRELYELVDRSDKAEKQGLEQWLG